MKSNVVRQGLFTPGTLLAKTLLIMKLTIVLLIAACLQLNARSFSQKISLSLKNASIESVFKEINKQTSYDFFYQIELLHNVPKMDVRVQNATIEETLGILFRNLPLTYNIIDKAIVVKKKTFVNSTGVINETPLPPPPIEIDGKITDGEGNPLIGASVKLKGSDKGVSTGENGDFKMLLDAPGGTLVISYVGFENKEIKISKSGRIGNITLSAEQSEMNDVVVVGYGTQKRGDITGAVSKFDAKNLKERPITRVDQAMIGQLAGVRVVQTNSIPGNGMSIQIRGSGSISAGSEPLYVIDGFPLEISSTSIVNGRSGTYASGNPLDNINPNDIESIQVLKDASAASIYGSRAANGVVLITTKKGQSGKPSISFNTFSGWNERSRKMDVLSPEEWIEQNVEYRNTLYILRDPGNQNRLITDDLATRIQKVGKFELATMYDPRTTEPGHPGLKFVDWQDEIFRKGQVSNYQLSASGGTNSVKYFMSGDYLGQQGYMLGVDYKRYAARANVEIKPNEKFTAGINLAPSYSIGNNPGVEAGIGAESKDGPLFRAVGLMPVIEADIPIEDINVGDRESSIWGYGSNRASMITRLKQTTDIKKTFRTLATVYAGYEFIPNLVAKTTLNFDNTDQTYKFYLPAPISGTSPANRQAEGSFSSYRKQTFVNENTLSYKTKIAGIHDISAVAGFSNSTNTFASSRITATGGFGSEYITTLNDAIGINAAQTNTYESKNVLLSYFGRINYNLNEKYLLAASIRRDGSSRFGHDTKWGVFPSASIGWRISEEKFMSGIDFLSELKFRGSWGILGNNSLVNDYGHISLLSSTNYVIGGNVVAGQSPGNFPNSELSWEESETINIGFDYGLFSNRIHGSFDYYTRRTTNMLLNIPIPAASGFTTALTNIGEVLNKGWELEINTRNLTGQFKWNTNVNLSFNTNTVKALGPNNTPIYGGDFDLTHNVLMVGYPMYGLYLVQQDGILTQKDIDDGAARYGSQTAGDPRFIDQFTIDTNGDGIPDQKDGIITAEDRVYSGHPNPDYIWGFSNTFSFKGFDLNILVQGQQGGKIYSTWGRAMDIGGAGQKIGAWRDHWRSPEDPGAGLKGKLYATYGSIKNTNWMYSSDYWRIRNITLGYDLGKAVKFPVFNSIRVYATAENWFGKDKYYGGYNPEAMNNQGDDYGGGPLPRSMTFGANFTFK